MTMSNLLFVFRKKIRKKVYKDYLFIYIIKKYLRIKLSIFYKTIV